jgi:predicted transcriptional regulator
MKPRIQPYVSHETRHRLQAMAKRPGLSESAIVEQALAAWFAGDVDNQREAAINRRLDRLTRQFSRIERDNLVLAETLATFVHYFLTVTPPVPASQVEAARAKGDLRFDLFVRQVAESLRSGQRILRAAVEEATADVAGLDGAPGHMSGERAGA